MAISNGRLLALADGKVTFRWKDHARGNRKGAMTLGATEFIRRFLMHVMPRGFVRIRYYGFMANRRRAANLARCRQLLGGGPVAAVSNGAAAGGPSAPAGADPAEGGAGDRCCPHCHQGRMRRVGLLTRLPAPHVEMQVGTAVAYSDTS
ncbi:MAG: Mobile element protein [Phycisphaerales bacterium]|nr:Mobile element protein [Phycisphaerales bacterium]